VRLGRPSPPDPLSHEGRGGERWGVGSARAHAIALGVLAALASCAPLTHSAPVPRAAPGESLVYITNESADQVTRLRYSAAGLVVEREYRVGINPFELEGPHGIALTPDGRWALVSIAHGTPNGTLWKLDTASGAVPARSSLGLFPATVDVTPDGRYAFVSNFNLHGDPVPSSVSKVELASMREVARTPTCVMPHGSRISPDGRRHYSVCMMNDELVEIDVASARISRRFSLAPGAERPLALEAPAAAQSGHAEHGGHAAQGASAAAVCSPTWAQPSADGKSVFVACNRSNEILEIDVERWALARRMAAGAAPYNLAVTPDGKYLLATLKNRTEPALEVYNLAAGRSVARLPASGVLPHGVAASRDGHHAFMTVEGVGSEPGRVDVFDLAAMRRVASAEVAPQAAGVAAGR